MNPVNPLRPGSPKRKKSSSGGIVITIILVLALAGGGVVYHRISVQREAEAAELAARREAEAKAARARKAAELEAARKAAEERARAEAAEKARLEAERLAAEEAARKRQKKEPEAVKPAPAEPKEEPVVREEDPRLEIFKKPVLLVSLKANNAANRKLFTDAFNLALETGRYDLYAGFLRSNLERDAVKVIKFGKFDVSMYDQSPYLMRANELYQLISKVGAETIQEQLKESSPRYFYPWLFSDPSDPLRLFLRTMAREQTPREEWGRHPAEVGGVLDENLRHAPEQVFLPGADLRHAGPPHRLQSVQAAGLFFHQYFHYSPDAGTGVRVLRGDG